MSDNVPTRQDGTVDFAALKPEQRARYLEGWGYATVRVPSKSATDKYFNIGAIEAMALTGMV
jgi:hypothetical protein